MIRPPDTKYKIIFELKKYAIEISDLDIDFHIRKNCKIEPDKAYLNIWNLDDNVFRLLLQGDSAVNLYASNRTVGKVLFFSGYVEQNSVKQNTYNAEGLSGPDRFTSMRLVDSYYAYTKSYINKDYRDNVEAKRILKDCIEAMNLDAYGIDRIFTNKTYYKFKAKGSPHNIIKKVCDDCGIELFLQNNTVRILSPLNLLYAVGVPEFNSKNCSFPRLENPSEVLFYYENFPFFSPGDIVKCAFENFFGRYFISEIDFKGNNYSQKGITKITIGI